MMSNREPVITAGLLTAAFSACLTLLKTFGVPITLEQQHAINELLAIVAPFLMALLVRNFVTPVADPRDHAGRTLVPEE
jgi:hypothetical protein